MAMDWIASKVQNRRIIKNTPESGDYLSKFYLDILKSIEANRKFIHSQRKYLDNFSYPTPPGRDSTKPDSASLTYLRKTQEDIFNLHKEFSKTPEDAFRHSLKLWEDECDSLIKSSGEVLKEFNDLQKAKSKLISIDGLQNDTQRNVVHTLENTYSKNADHLKQDLMRYYLSEVDRNGQVTAYLQLQLKFYRDCILKLEEQCSNVASLNEGKSGTYFGTKLAEHLNDKGCSKIIEVCIGYLTLKKHYKSEGIFRLAGQLSHIQLLREAFDKNMENEELLDYCGVNVVADVLKQYLRELPDPLLSQSFVDQWQEAKDNMTTERAYSIIKDLPTPNYKNFVCLLQFLDKVVKHEKHSKMNPTNLSTVLYMNLYWRSSEQNIMGLHIMGPILQYLFENCSEILKSETETTVFEKVPLTPGSEPSSSTALSGSKVRNSSPFSHYNVESRQQGTDVSSSRNSGVQPPTPSNSTPTVPARSYINRSNISESSAQPKSDIKRVSILGNPPPRPGKAPAPPPPKPDQAPPPQLPPVKDGSVEMPQEPQTPKSPAIQSLPPSEPEISTPLSNPVQATSEPLATSVVAEHLPEGGVKTTDLTVDDGQVVLTSNVSDDVVVSSASSRSSVGDMEQEKNEETCAVLPDSDSRKNVDEVNEEKQNQPTKTKRKKTPKL